MYSSLCFVAQSPPIGFISSIAFELSIGLNLSSLISFILRIPTDQQLLCEAVVILFQPEIRRALEQLGRRGVLRNQFKDLSKESAYATVHMLVDAIDDFSSTKTGALIAIEGETMLTDIIETGVVLNSEISVRLLGNLFYEGSPLHDGAVIIRNARIIAAGCFLPTPQKEERINKQLGSRHRAAIGMSENSDAIIVVVSEETGTISIAENGELTRGYTKERLIKYLKSQIVPEKSSQDNKVFGKLFGRKEPIDGGRKNKED